MHLTRRQLRTLTTLSFVLFFSAGLVFVLLFPF
jgi:hypothetical protein